MWKKIALGLAAALGLFLGAAAMQPDTYKVTRTARIAAAPEAVHGRINDFHNWDQWSPWAKLDPAMKTTYSGAASGKTASYYWIGNDKVGEGRMTILDSEPGRSVKIDLEFIQPFPGKALTVFTVAPEGTGSVVEWTMTGDNNFLSKVMCLVMGGMDKMIGPDFERGLGQLKAASEKG